MATRFDRAKEKRMTKREIKNSLQDETDFKNDLMDMDIYGDIGDDGLGFRDNDPFCQNLQGDFGELADVLANGSDEKVTALFKLLNHFSKN